MNLIYVAVDSAVVVAEERNVHGAMAMDTEKARRFISAVPKGCWTAYKDVAIAAGDPGPGGGWRVGQWLRHSGGSIPTYWRVLTVDGDVPDTLVGGGAGPYDAAAARDVLRREGVWMDAAGRARQSQRFTVEDWSEAIEGRKAARAATIATWRSELPDDLAALGTLASKAQDPEAAIAINMAILEQTPGDVVAMNRLGRAYEAAGSTDEALRTFRRALELDPTNTIARGRLRNLVRNMR